MNTNTNTTTMTTTTNRAPFDQVVADFRSLEKGMQTMIRNTASLSLQQYNPDEIGSSDISCEVVSLFHQLGSWEEVIRHGIQLIRNR
jgi:hypothetical protein